MLWLRGDIVLPGLLGRSSSCRFLEEGMGVMGARRLVLVALTSVCVQAMTLTLSGGPAFAASPSHFGTREPVGVAVSRASEDVFTDELYGYRVDRFDDSGKFQLAWGWDVNEAEPAEELQTCTVECQRGAEAFGTGGIFLPGGIAVDNEPSSSSYGDVYVSEFGNFRVEKFDPNGKFLLMFGGEVNETKAKAAGASEAEKNVCIVGEACQRGVPGAGNGQFEYGAAQHSYIAVGPGGRVYVGDKARIEIFEPSGAWRESVPLAVLSTEGKVDALAVDSTGDVFLADEGVAGVRELEPGPLGGWVEKAITFDSTSTSMTAITLDGSGHLYVADSSHILEYDVASGEEMARFGAETASVSYGLAFSDKLNELYVTGYYEGDVWVLTPPPPGPLIIGESATPELRGVATLAANLNAEGSETTYHFEYVTRTQYEKGGFGGASSTAPATAGAAGDFEDHAVSVHLTGLEPGVTYEYRLVASNSQGTATGEVQTLEETPTALIDGPWVNNVSDRSATFEARIDPLGAATSYRLEWGTTTAYGHSVSGEVGAGMDYVLVSFHRQDFEPVTTYHMRIVTESEVGTVDGPDRSFTTQSSSGEELSLLDGRHWELVSPPDKKGALIEPTISIGKLIQASVDGSAIFYESSEPIGEGGQGKGLVTPNISTRTPSGWTTRDLTVHYVIPPEGTTMLEVNSSYAPEYKMFNSDLSLGAIDPDGVAPPLSPEATERTVYLRDMSSNRFTPLVTCKDVEVSPCPKFGGSTKSTTYDTSMHFEGATPDMRHVFVRSPFALTKEGSTDEFASNVYEWSEGRLQLVNVLPNGTTSPQAVLGDRGEEYYGTRLGPSAVSDDGRFVAWGYAETHLYLRDMVAHKTVQLGGRGPLFEGMSGDGSRVFFIEGELYVYEPETRTTMSLTADHGPEEGTAGVQDALLGKSEDGSYVYFVATGVLASGAVKGQDNLYELHYESGKWTTTYVTTLSSRDEKDWSLGISEAFGDVVGRVSPDGRYVTFMSQRSLTGYDNRDAVSGQPDEEVYAYDAAADGGKGKLVCASCNPTGARPVGLFDHSLEETPLIDREGIWAGVRNNAPTWLAADLPGWLNDGFIASPYVRQARDISNDGRLFFNSTDALVPQDTNGRADVYEHEPAGIGNCTAASATFSAPAGGCVNLISSGTSSFESDFYDASATGPGGEEAEDVFFITQEKLVPEDYDASLDVYDAHQCSARVPCRSVPVTPPACTSGDSCKAAPSPQPEIFGPAPSATFSGTGNVVEGSSHAGLTQRSLSRSQKLARALRACRKRRARSRRTACERHARQRYGQSRKGKATRKGNR